MAEAELRTLNIKRGSVKAKVTRFVSFVDSVNNDNDLIQLKLRIAKFEPCWQEFDEIQSSIELLDPENAAPQVEERESFENSYFSAMASAQQCLKRISPVEPPIQQQQHNNRENQTQVKLPTINLPTFSGAYDQWLPFNDTFHSLIHNDRNMSAVQKLHYLKSALAGDAAQVIHSLEVSALNYEVAWTLLKERYQNNRIIVQTHVKALFELPIMNKENHAALRQLHDTMSRHLRALKTLEQPTDSWDTIMIHLITSKFDPITKREWETVIDPKKLPTMADMNKFLCHRCQLLESLRTDSASSDGKLNTSQPGQSRNHYNTSSRNQQRTPLAFVNTVKPECPQCKQGHSIYHCEKFKSLSISDRITETKRLRLCLNCLRSDHQLADCRSSNCRLCDRKHNTLLHLTSKGSKPTPEQPGPSILHVSRQQEKTQVLLSTALVLVFDRQGKPHTCRALLDSGSQSSFMTRELRQRLKLDSTRVNLPISGINHVSAPVSQTAQATIQSRFNAFSATLTFLVLDHITERLPVTTINKGQLKIPGNLRLADPQFNTPQTVDMLLGAEVFWDLLCVGQIRTHNTLPILQKTHLGWIVSGRLPASNKNLLGTTQCHLSTQSLQEQLTKFWVQEETAPVIRHSVEEKSCETIFQSSTTRDSEGRFIVKFPFRDDPQILGNSKETALKRLYQVEKRLAKNPSLKQQYIAFMREYIDLNYMELVQEPDNHEDKGPTYYLPHHAVIKQSSATTKVRVAFDGSSKTSSGVALNDLLLIGPTVQDDLFSIVIRFRTHQYVLTADIVKMYRQVWMHPEHAELQRIFWREEPTHKLQRYRLKTITYGTASAPFLATRCLQQLAIDEKHAFPEAAKIISRDFYVDDLLTGVNSFSELSKLKTEITEVLSKGGLQMHKWNSNCAELRDDQSPLNLDPKADILTKNESIKTLGLLWNSDKDCLSFQTSLQCATHSLTKRPLTKRRILSLIAQIFDPLGLLGPIIVVAKLLVQQLWQLKIDWDESVPQAIFTRWQRYEIELNNINDILIPRHVMCTSPSMEIQVHGFCDASEIAFGACLYIRSTDSTGIHSTHLLCAKSRVAPLKTITIPRLELCGALLLAQLAAKATSAMNITVNKHYFWTDSTVALSWIQSSPHHWKTFVANRSSEIQGLTNHGEWNHVNTRDNPADVLSRGSTISELKNNSLWWSGPAWLAQDETSWPISDISSTLQANTLESRPVNIVLHVTEIDNSLFERYSSLTKLTKVVAQCLRFKVNCLFPNQRRSDVLQPHELQCALTCIIKMAQRECFGLEIEQLNQSAQVHSRSKLLPLLPFLDHHGVLRVGGRLRHALISEEQRHPAILPAKHRLTVLVIQQVHLKHMHAGQQATLAAVRLRFWPLAGRQAVRKVLRTCVPCFRVKPTSQTPLMGDLPADRINPSRPFSVSGVDFCGPLLIRIGARRSTKTAKAYIAIFVCFATRAAHLELVGDLTTESFLGALKRFMSRRGKCVQLFSDNATNFVGANRELQELKKQFNSENNITSFLSEEGITWQFIPANSPHFGGLWEAGVKASKHHLRRVVGNATLSFEELSTILAQVEACLNSRPLTPLSSDPTDLTYLTPGHFLIGNALTAIGEPSLMHLKINRLSRWQRTQQITQHFWSRWSKEYLSQLQARQKWRQSTTPVTVGSMVLLREDNIPPLQWPLGRVTTVHPGNDGIIRVLTVQTAKGSFKRAVAKVCVLPLEEVIS